MKTIVMRPTIYAFGLPVPSWIRWPLMILAISTVLAIPAVITGIAFLVIKCYVLRKRPVRQPANRVSGAVVA